MKKTVFTCPQCKKQLRLKAEYNEPITIRCTSCGKTFSTADPDAPPTLSVNPQESLNSGDQGISTLSFGSPSNPPSDPQGPPGYQILEEIGRGGMGVVYKARQMQLKRFVALKTIRGSDRRDEKEVIRFLAEAEAVAAIRHLHVVQVHEYGQFEGNPFMALEFLSGGTLAALIKKEKRIPPARAARLLAKLARGMSAAHQRGFIHRDLKPGNVLFDEQGVPKIADFGLAKRGQSELTHTQAVMGTPAYMAPEQAAGKSKFVGPPADVYALGVILYECLAGRRPFQADSPDALLAKVVMLDPEPLIKNSPEVPRDLNLICMKCLAKDPIERYPTALELAEDLEHFIAGEPVSVRPANLLEKSYRWAKRKPSLAATYALGFLVLILGIFGTTSWNLWRQADQAKMEALSARDQANTAKENESQARSDAERSRDSEKVARKEAENARDNESKLRGELKNIHYHRMIHSASQSLKYEGWFPARKLLDQIAPEYRQTWEWRYLDAELKNGRIAVIPYQDLGTLHILPDGSHTIEVRDKRILPWENATGKKLKETKTLNSGFWSILSPNGKSLAFGSKRLFLWDIAKWEEIPIPLPNPAGSGELRISRVAFRESDQKISIAFRTVPDQAKKAKSRCFVVDFDLETKKTENTLELDFDFKEGMFVAKAFFNPSHSTLFLNLEDPSAEMNFGYFFDLKSGKKIGTGIERKGSAFDVEDFMKGGFIGFHEKLPVVVEREKKKGFGVGCSRKKHSASRS